MRQSIALPVLFATATLGLWGQGINTPANVNDWEEINFAYNSSVLVDGFPSLLKLAELLRQNEGYRVRVVGYTDQLGSVQYNQNLGLMRANAVRDFLLKYGARASQITASSLGETAPRVSEQPGGFRRTDEARFMNRRVVLTVTDAQGNTIGAGGAGDAIRAITQTQPQAPAEPPPCCQEVLRRLDQLDDIAKALKDLAEQNAALRKDLDDLRRNQQAAAQGQQALQQGQQALESRLSQPPPQPPKPPSAGEVAGAVEERLAASRPPLFQLLGLNVGSDAGRNPTFSGRGRFFKPFGDHFGVQAQAEYYYLRGQREGQFDIGLTDRLGKRVQAGLFASFKNVSLAGNQSSGALGQGSFVLDYIFSRGKLGLFATKGFKTQSLINRANGRNADGTIQNNILLERYLSVVDQAGLASTIGLMGNVYAEGNVAYLRSTASSNRAGGSLRLVFPVNDKFALTVEGGVNETLLPVQGTQQGRAAVGFQLGNFLRPKNLLAETHAVPMEVPRVRYETLTKRIRTGNDAPVADAGPDQTNVEAGPVTLNGSGSYDPDGDPLTYQWVQEAGPAVPLSGANTALASFTAALGQAYSFRLIVRDNQGGQGQARVSVNTRADEQAQILYFIADPRQIAAGQQATLSWKTLAAASVTISGGVGTVAAQGSVAVSPASTTTYTLTAAGGGRTETAQVTVVVTGATFLSCFATPATITQGQSTTLTWTTQSATSVSIAPGIGAVGASGTLSVTPSQSTNYTLTAAGQGATSTCSIGVTVLPAPPQPPGVQPPVIALFSASPATIDQGQSSTLTWNVTGATSVSITNLGPVSAQGTQMVSPSVSTTYVLTATNAAGSVTAQATVNVNIVPGPAITEFVAIPQQLPPNQRYSSRLLCSALGAESITIAGTTFTQVQTAVLMVSPEVTTTYTCVARDLAGRTATKQVTVYVVPWWTGL
jgi:hypothetical protein